MTRFCLLFLFVVVAIVFVDSYQQQQCIKLTTSLCDDDVNDETQHSILEKAGSKGEKGERGESSNQNDGIIDVITMMNQTLYELKDTLVDMQGRLTKLEDKNAVYELRLTPRKGTFDEAREMCQQLGGDLMQKTLLTSTPGGSYQEKFKSLNAERWSYIGITDREVEGNWRYLNGEGYIEENSISAWRTNTNEPNGGRRENCGSALEEGNNETPIIINDYPCNGHLYGVCEIKI